MASLNRNILAVSWAMPPLLLPRALQISRLLKQGSLQGWNTTVLTVEPASLKNSVLLDENLAALYKSYYTTATVASPERSLALRTLFRILPFLREMPDEKRLWALQAIRQGRALQAKNNYSLLISFAQPWSSHLAGLRLHQATGLPWIAHFSDPWTAGSHSKMSAWAARQAKVWETQVVETATRLVFVNQETADATMAAYPAALKSKVRVVSHGFDRDILKNLKPSPAQTKGPLTLVHSGHFYGNRTPWAFLEALRELNQATPLTNALEVRFIGHVPSDFLEKAVSLGLGSVVKAWGSQPYFDALQALQNADVLLLIEAAGLKNHLYFPSKLVDYFLFQKPIFGLTPLGGPSARLLEQLGCSTVQPDDVPGIQKALKELLAQKQAGRLRVSETFSKTVDAYDIRRTAAEFQKIMEDVLKD